MRPARPDAADDAAFDPRFPSLITLRVADLSRALAFWHERLGLPVKLRAEGVVELQSETVILALVQGSPQPGSCAIAWEVADLEGARSELASRGIVASDVEPPQGVDRAVFGRRLAFEDPDGHRLELVTWS